MLWCRDDEENYEGVKAAPFNYSGRWIIGVKRYNEEKNKELNRVLKLKVK